MPDPNPSPPPAAPLPAPAQVRERFSPRVLALATLLVSLLITGSFWYHAQSSKKAQVRSEFEFQARAHGILIARRMKTYEQVLRGAKGLIRGSVAVEPSEFRDYVSTLEIADNYPGIQGIAVAEIVPPGQLQQHIQRLRSEGYEAYRVWPLGDRPVVTAITRIEPFNIMNQRALGFDMYSEPTRRAAMDTARDTGRAALSGKVKLVQEGSTGHQAGVLMYLPVYREGAPAGSVAQRRQALIGWVYAPFRIGDLVGALRNERSDDFSLSIFDGTERSSDACLYGCTAAAMQPARHELATLSTVTVAGRPWLLDVRANPAFLERAANATSVLIAAGGIVTSLLLAALVWVLGSGRQRALMLATDMTSELRASTERTQAERKRLELILSNSYDAFVAFDAHGRITYWNEQAAHTFGWSAGEALGREVAALLVAPARHAAWHEAIAGLDADDAPLHTRRFEMEAQHRDGRTIFVEMSVVVLDDGSGASFNAFIRDLTERHEAEERERAQQQSLEQARRALESAQRLESIGMLTGGVAHDFNNVLQIISGNVQLMMHNIGTDRDKRLRSIADAVERGARLSSQLLSFARRQQLRPQAINLPVLLVNIDDLLKRAVGDGVTLGVLAQQDLWDVMADAGQLENVILNLAINARDAMRGRGNFELALSNVTLEAGSARSAELEPGDYVCIAARDTGSGMPAEVRARAFEPFFTTKAEGLGSGLGLSMAYGFAKQSGGHIEIDSVMGGGTTITIWLPRSREAPREDNGAPFRRQAAGGRGETILVVDDDRAVQEMAVEILEDLGYRVLRADDGESALKVLEQAGSIDLLFTDVVMPGPVSSTDLVKMATERQPGLAVLFTSGYARNLLSRPRDLVPDAPLLSKPYPREMLAYRVRELLDQRATLART
ncbi:CHASE domain-containing protein [Pseudoduganella sp. GCM10020061]|uniref:CHASE domain-containing protein n=1 Tax=Pseudoduganella sp. GCM10020061 TaxID=3317345 RepID=UPI00363A8939